MHEFSIALNIVDIASETALRHHAKKVTEMVIEIGEVSGVVPEALDLALQSAVKNTLLEGSKTVIIHIPATALCKLCGCRFRPENLVTICPECNSLNVDIISGKEMRVKSIVIDE